MQPQFRLLVGTLVLLCVFSAGACTEDLEALKTQAAQGDAAAQNNLGQMYDKGQGVGQDDGEALKWYRRATDPGHGLACVGLAIMYDKGWGVAQDEVCERVLSQVF